MNAEQAHAINEAAWALSRLCRLYGANDELRALAANMTRLSDAPVDAMAPVIPQQEQAA